MNELISIFLMFVSLIKDVFNSFIELVIFLLQFLPTLIVVVNCIAATVSAIRIFNFNNSHAQKEHDKFLGFVAWGLFVSFSSIPIMTLFGEYENHNVFEMFINVFIAAVLWRSKGSVAIAKFLNSSTSK